MGLPPKWKVFFSAVCSGGLAGLNSMIQQQELGLSEKLTSHNRMPWWRLKKLQTFQPLTMQSTTELSCNPNVQRSLMKYKLSLYIFEKGILILSFSPYLSVILGLNIWIPLHHALHLQIYSVVWMLYECCMNVVWILYECCMNVVWMLYECCINVVSMLYQCCINVVSMLYQCCINVVSTLYQCCINVVSMRHTHCTYNTVPLDYTYMCTTMYHYIWYRDSLYSNALHRALVILLQFWVLLFFSDVNIMIVCEVGEL